ncbi:beta-ketoacyl synthase chain length factor [Marinihelvus fidelis]|uniref:Beta-ketoacyl synthase chain length factor n=1 Tax=Marinihelvus fidelis TaxID=2613842 RepID=A0A5N0T8Y6_9GAMM|nr:beta-ketoacyl synthase chain length factor [Marinihelvus fidelis]KAA9131402.1 beta-ketoacyl synthase chain length factor [Marinihelvus fidelis]
MKARIAGIGAWGPGFNSADTLMAIIDSGEPAVGSDEAAATRPAATVIPPRERRRAPLSVKLAVEAAGQACTAAEVEPAEAACVFVSALGDLDITDYMCRTLASDTPQLSPTKFHNSVHNAPVGYWSISTGNHHAGNAVAAGPDYSLAASLMEAFIQCEVEQRPVLWVTQDIAAPAAYQPLWPVDHACAFALLLLPCADEAATRLERTGQPAEWPPLEHPTLTGLYNDNPSARVLALLQAHQFGEPVDLPLAPGQGLRISLP